MKVGMHISFAGMYNTLMSAYQYELDTYQAFIRSNRGGPARFFPNQDIEMYNRMIFQGNIKDFVIHASYVMNPASTEVPILEKTYKTITEDMYTLSRLAGRKYYVLHPGAAKDNNPIVANNVLINTLHSLSDKYLGTNICLEIMAGQGTQLMSDIESIEYIVSRCSDIPEFGLCVDLCHCFAAGIDIKDLLVFSDKIKVVHANNSVYDWRSFRDRHSNLEKGRMPVDKIYEDLSTLESVVKDLITIVETPEPDIYYDFKLLKNKFS